MLKVGQQSHCGPKKCTVSGLKRQFDKWYLLSALKIAAIFAFAIPMPIADPRNCSDIRDKRMLHCDLKVRLKVASDLRFRAAISDVKTPSFCRIPGDLAPSTRKSLAIAIVRFWCAKGTCFTLPPV